ncbi:Gr2p [Chamberlinius hualienensis]
MAKKSSVTTNKSGNSSKTGPDPVYVWSENMNHNETRGIYYALRPTILFANVFGVSTMTNVTKATTQTLQFRWLNLRTIYGLFVLFTSSLTTVTAFIHFFNGFKDNVEDNKFSSITNRLGAPCFYLSASLSFALILNLTTKLPSILKSWDGVARRLIKYTKGQKRHWTIDGRGCGMSMMLTTLVTSVFMTSAIVEHILSDVHIFRTTNCTRNMTIYECSLKAVNEFVIGVFGTEQYFFMITTYVINKYANFAWNFHDLVIIQISLHLAFNFKTISKYLNHYSGKMPSIEWRIIREDHNSLCQLCKEIDNHLSILVLLSFGINVFFLAKQIYMGVKLKVVTVTEVMYAIMSFAHLVGRIIAVTFSASALHEQALLPMNSLLNCPSESYNIEVQRFVDQLNYSNVGFTGWHMFVVNRYFFLAVSSYIKILLL